MAEKSDFHRFYYAFIFLTEALRIMVRHRKIFSSAISNRKNGDFFAIRFGISDRNYRLNFRSGIPVFRFSSDYFLSDFEPCN